MSMVTLCCCIFITGNVCCEMSYGKGKGAQTCLGSAILIKGWECRRMRTLVYLNCSSIDKRDNSSSRFAEPHKK